MRLYIDEELNLGKIGIIEWVIKKTGIKHFKKDEKDEILTAWNENWEINQNMLKLAKGLKKNSYKICVCSNCDKDNLNFYDSKYLFREFDERYFSCDCNALKPKLFDQIKDSVSHPSSCLIIDDNIKNIQYAKKIGFLTHQIDRDLDDKAKELMDVFDSYLIEYT